MTTGSVPLYSAPLLYSRQRALETVQALDGFTPVRIFLVLFPLWEVEIIGTQRRSQHYELVEDIVSQSIAKGQLRSTAEIATFLGIPERHVEKALVFLRQVGHLRGSDGSLALTQLGRESLAAGVSYRELETRRKLYFDAFWSHPLPQEYYEQRMLSEVEALSHPDRRILPLYSFRPWRPEALPELARRSDRANWNLPDEVRDLRERGVALAYLPMYVVHTMKRQTTGAHVFRYLALTRRRGLCDPFFEEIINREPDLRNPLLAPTKLDIRALMEQEIIRRGLDSDHARLECSDSGAWRVVVRPDAFQSEEKRFSTQDIGRCWLVRDHCLQVWCEDTALRRQAALDQVIAIMRRWKRKMTKQDVDQLLETHRLRLNTQTLSIVDLQTRAFDDRNAGILALLPT